MKLWQRIIVVVASVAAIYMLWHHKLHGAEELVLTVAALFMGRMVHTSHLTRNPLGENRDFSLRPVAAAALKAAGYMVAAFFWAVLTGYAIRLGYVSDTWHGAGLLLVPALVFLVVSVMYVGKAMGRFQLGGTPPGD